MFPYASINGRHPSPNASTNPDSGEKAAPAPSQTRVPEMSQAEVEGKSFGCVEH